MAARLGLAKAKATQEGDEATREATKALRETTMAQRGELGAKDDLRQYEQMRIRQIENKYKLNPMFGTDPKLQAQFNAEVAAIQSDPQYLALLKQAFPNLQLPSAAPSTGGWSIKPKQ